MLPLLYTIVLSSCRRLCRRHQEEAQQRHLSSQACSCAISPTSNLTLPPIRKKAASVIRTDARCAAQCCLSRAHLITLNAAPTLSHVIRDCASFVVANFVSGVVLRAFHNGTEAAVKRPKIKVTLNPRELKKFTQEVMTMLKARDVFPVCCAVF